MYFELFVSNGEGTAKLYFKTSISSIDYALPAALGGYKKTKELGSESLSVFIQLDHTSLLNYNKGPRLGTPVLHFSIQPEKDYSN